MTIKGYSKIARTLVTRGQTIYGRNKIVDACSAAGIELMEGYDSQVSDDLDAYKQFLIEYSKLGPAARITLLILAKQNEIELPEEALKGSGKFPRFP